MSERSSLPGEQGDPMGEPPPPFDTESRQEHSGVDQERMRRLKKREHGDREGEADREGRQPAGEAGAGQDSMGSASGGEDHRGSSR